MKNIILLLIIAFGFQMNAQTIYTQPITATKAYQSVYGTATIQIDDAGSDGLLTKPLIVVEGLDTGLLAQTGNMGDTDITTFSKETQKSLSSELQTLLNGGTIFTSGDQDYDIIYVNWDNGTDYIQRNAYVLEEVIDWVNENKTGTEANVVLGQSMGGLIARYALRDMENNSETHDTSLYISHDAPHQGAHIPLGLLYMARHAVDQFIDTGLGNFEIPVGDTGNVTLGSLEELLEAPAVEQMLISNVTSGFNHTTSTHDSWQSTLETIGYPQQTRNIALSNANHCAEPQGLISNELLLDFSFEGNTSGLSDILLFITGGGAIVGDIFNDTATFFLGFLPGNTKLDAEFKVNAYPTSGTSRVYKGKLTYEKTLLWLIPITRTITDRSYNSPSGVKFLDNYPGGVNPTGDALANNGYIDNILGNVNYSFSINPDFNFISATSALDVGSGNATLLESDYLEVYTAIDPPLGIKAIPFNNFTTTYNTSTINEPHITFNKRNADWLAEEIDADSTVDIFDCSFVCDDVSEINGGNNLCNSGGIYSIPTGADTVSWSFTPSNAAQIVSGQGTNIVSIAINSGYNNNFTITAYLTSARCSATNTITKTIWAGKPKTPTSLTGPTTVNTGALVNYKSGTSTGATSYKWLLPYPFGVSNPIDYFSQDWQMAPTTGKNLTAMTGYGQNAGLVQVMGENSCGSGGAKTLYVQHGSGGGGGIPIANDDTSEVGIPFNYFKVHPNPANRVVFIDLLDKNNIPDRNTRIYGVLYDLFGNKAQKVSIKNNRAMIQVSRLVSGSYVLHIYVGNTVENHKIIIK